MERYSHFEDIIEKNAATFKEIVQGKNVRLISHLDSDGICAASIMIKALLRLGVSYSLSIVQQLKESILKEIENEKYDLFIFTDLGSGQIKLIDKYIPNKTVFILDHHEIKKTELQNKNIYQVNPHLAGIDGSQEISGSGVVYKFCEKIDERNKDMSHLAIIGAIGDVQENNGFKHLNQEILNTAVEQKKIKIETGLKFFGLQTKPIYKVLSYSTDPIIPGVSGDELGTIEFMKSIGVNPYIGHKGRKFYNLTEEEKQKLITSLIIKRSGEKNPEDILGKIYYINGEVDGSPTKDAREFSTLINACGRLNKASIGIGACLNDEKTKKKAILTLAEYRTEIINTITWYEKNKNDHTKIIRGKNYIIIRPKNEILVTLIGTLSSIISRGKNIEPDTYIMSLADQDDFNTKVSIRVSGNKDIETVDVKKIMEDITNKIGGESGGHKLAAGALITPEIEDEFVGLAIQAFKEKYKEKLIINEI